MIATPFAGAASEFDEPTMAPATSIAKENPRIFIPPVAHRARHTYDSMRR
jgi:hypothetical protein